MFTLDAHQEEANQKYIECASILFKTFLNLRAMRSARANGYATSSCEKWSTLTALQCSLLFCCLTALSCN